MRGSALAAALMAGLLIVAWRYGTPVEWINVGEAPGVTVTWDRWLLLQAAAAHRLLGLVVVPIGLTVDYDYDALAQPQAGVLGLVTLGGLACLAWRVRQRRPRVAFGLAWVLIVIAPRLVIQTPRSYFSEHQLYLALVGVAMVVGSLVRSELE